MTTAMEAAKDAVQTAENLMHRHVAENITLSTPLTLRDGMILTTALIKVMEAIEHMEAGQ